MMASERMTRLAITVLDATYVAFADNEPAKFIGLWYHDEQKAHVLLFAPDRTDILAAESGDKGTLIRDGDSWDFVPQSN